MSSVGVLAAPLATDGVRSRVEPVGRRDARADGAAVRRARGGGRRGPVASGVRRDITHERSIDMRYVGQGFEVTVPVEPGEDLEGRVRGGLRPLARPQGPGRADRGDQLARADPRPGPRPAARRGARPATVTRRRARATCGSTTRYVATPIYDRYRMGPGTQIEGPAIVEERESTTVVGPGATARVAEDGSLIIEVAHDARPRDRRDRRRPAGLDPRRAAGDARAHRVLHDRARVRGPRVRRLRPRGPDARPVAQRHARPHQRDGHRRASTSSRPSRRSRWSPATCSSPTTRG